MFVVVSLFIYVSLCYVHYWFLPCYCVQKVRLRKLDMCFISFRECVQTYGTNNMEIGFTLVSGLSACRPHNNFWRQKNVLVAVTLGWSTPTLTHHRCPRWPSQSPPSTVTSHFTGSLIGGRQASSFPFSKRSGPFSSRILLKCQQLQLRQMQIVFQTANENWIRAL